MPRILTEAQKEAIRVRQRARYANDPEFRRKSREATERWEKANPGASYTPEYGRRKQMERRYGLTVEQYEILLKAQDGHCALCPAVQGAHKRRLTVDHDHKCCDNEKACGKCNRGILCANCNRMLGFLELLIKDFRNPENGIVDLKNSLLEDSWTFRALQYLKRYATKHALDNMAREAYAQGLYGVKYRLVNIQVPSASLGETQETQHDRSRTCGTDRKKPFCATK